MPVATTPPGGRLITGRLRAQLVRTNQLLGFILNANTAELAKVPPLAFLTAGQVLQTQQLQTLYAALLAAKIPVPPPPV